MEKINHFKHERDAVVVPQGQVVFRQGTNDSVMYAVLDGEVELSVDGHVVERVGAGGIVGELALIDPAPHSSTATAATQARVVPVDRPYFVQLVQQHPTFALQVMTIMAERLRRARVGSASADAGSPLN
jgi:CRP/FNR family transcriptional regulator, cyclic AMP receptor protein